MKKIFIQIASYRDSELLPTLNDAVAKSSGKNELSFGLVWQKDNNESIGEFSKDPRVRIIDVPWEQSKGLGWARSLTQSLYKDEDYTLQLDSHHRFANNWDQVLIDMIYDLKDQSPKPLLTSYAASYDPNNDKLLNGQACKILPHDFKSSGTIWFNPTPINDSLLNRPLKARLVSGHYFFTLGCHCKEYVYDPELYFAGDEIALSARSYTMGYDLYHPHVNLVWHHYGRKDRTKHWSDHTDKNKEKGIVEKTWKERDEWSKKKLRCMLGEENTNIDLGVYGLGNIRSIKDYEKYTGFDFKNRRIQQSAINGKEPPVMFNSEQDWNKDFSKRSEICIKRWDKSNFIKNIHNTKVITLEFTSLQQKNIHKQMFSTQYILDHDTINTVVVSDYIPMKFRLTAFNKNNNVIHTVTNDMKNNIHWS
jgi:hypothetical protein